MGIVKKLTGEQVLEILVEKFEEVDEGVDNFAYNELGELVPEDFVCSDEVEKLRKIKDEAYENYKLCDDKDESDKLWNIWRDLEDPGDREVQEYFDSIGLGKVVEVQQQGGMDEGSNWFSIKHFVDHDIYIKTSGFYASHYGTDFDGIGEVVVPKSKVITVYEK